LDVISIFKQYLLEIDIYHLYTGDLPMIGFLADKW